MCDFEIDDPAQVWVHKWRKARSKKDGTPHKCDACGCTIAKGEAYLSHFSISDGDVYTAKACALCGAVWEWFTHEHNGGYSPDYILTMLRECIAEYTYRGMFKTLDDRKAFAAKVRAENGHWRTAYAVLWRRYQRNRRLRQKAA